MKMPGFTAISSLTPAARTYAVSAVAAKSAMVQPQAFGRVGGFGGFGSTLPSCRYERRWVVCGTPLPGYPAPLCPEWVYVCCWPNGTCGVM